MKDIDEEVMLEDLEGDYPKPILLEDLGMMYATENSKRKYRFGLYKCGFCGTTFKANTYEINKGRTKSCGCLHKQKSTTHNLSKTRVYTIWKDIIRRTSNKASKKYKYYGGRGITICKEWLDVQNFYDWAMLNGYSDELSIDRIDNEEGYSPENCRWTTKIIQQRNTRKFKNNTSGYRGVSFNKRREMFEVRIYDNKKCVRLGYFKTAVEGGIAYNNYIIENNLEGYNLNEIPEVQK